ncbi:MAG: hypothetical protein ACOX7J_02745 [Bacillota bacterium]|jgi:hypothetical protein
MLEFIEIQYRLGKINSSKVLSYVPRWLSADEAYSIIGQEDSSQ